MKNLFMLLALTCLMIIDNIKGSCKQIISIILPPRSVYLCSALEVILHKGKVHPSQFVIEGREVMSNM